MTQKDGTGREEGGGRRVQDWEHMYTCGGFIDIWQNQYNIVKLKKQTNKQTKSLLKIRFQ